MIDVTQEVNAVGRQLDTGRTVAITKVYDTSVEDLWDACTSPERIPRWFLPISGDLHVGGRYQLEGHAGGAIQSCDPPKGFSATWEYGGDVSWIEVRFAAEPDGRARLTLRHTVSDEDPKWTEFGPGAVGVGWDLAVLGLSLHVGGADPLDPAATMAWMGSDEGKQFITLSGHAWYDAHLAAGAPPDDARAAADRTIAAYTGS